LIHCAFPHNELKAKMAVCRVIICTFKVINVCSLLSLRQDKQTRARFPSQTNRK
jgi:hypothetical protein